MNLYKHIKNVRKNRYRNIILAIDNLLAQMGNPEDTTEKNFYSDFLKAHEHFEKRLKSTCNKN